MANDETIARGGAAIGCSTSPVVQQRNIRPWCSVQRTWREAILHSSAGAWLDPAIPAGASHLAQVAPANPAIVAAPQLDEPDDEV